MDEGSYRLINRERVDGSPCRANAAMAQAICYRGYILETGKIILEGKAAELTGNDRVRQAHLGG